MEEIFCSFIISVGLLLLLIPKNKQKGGNNMLNIYNNKLKPCGDKNMSSGSWDNKKMCSEKDGGVHQICIKKISKNTQNFLQLQDKVIGLIKGKMIIIVYV